MLILRVVFTILSALCLGALLPVFAFGWQYSVLCGAAAFLFFILMLICKQAQERAENKQEPNKPDFITKK